MMTEWIVTSPESFLLMVFYVSVIGAFFYGVVRNYFEKFEEVEQLDSNK